MKNIRNKFLALLLITSGAFFSCKKGDPIKPMMPTVTNTTPAPTGDNPTLTRGDWRIATFNINDVDGATKFNGYLFSFNNNGNIKVIKDNNTINGSWLARMEEGQENFIITFTSSPLDELNGTWHIKGQTLSDLKLERIRGANGEADNLTFRRNQQEFSPETSK